MAAISPFFNMEDQVEVLRETKAYSGQLDKVFRRNDESLTGQINARFLLKEAQRLEKNFIISKQLLASMVRKKFETYLHGHLENCWVSEGKIIEFFDAYNTIMIALFPVTEYLQPWGNTPINILPFLWMQERHAYVRISERLFLETYSKVDNSKENPCDMTYIKMILEYVEMSPQERESILEYGISHFRLNFEHNSPHWTHLEDYWHIIDCASDISHSLGQRYIEEGAKILLEDLNKAFDIPTTKFPLEALQVLYDICEDKGNFVKAYLESSGLLPITDCDSFFNTYKAKYNCLDKDLLDDFPISIEIKAYLQDIIQDTFKDNMIDFYRKLRKFCDNVMKEDLESNGPFVSEYTKQILKKLIDLIPDRIEFVEKYFLLDAMRLITYSTKSNTGNFEEDFPELNTIFNILQENTPHVSDFMSQIQEAMMSMSKRVLENGQVAFVPLYFPEVTKQVLQIKSGNLTTPCWPTKDYSRFWNQQCENAKKSKKVLNLSLNMQVFVIESDIKLKSGKNLDLVCTMNTASILYLYNDNQELTMNEIVDELGKVNEDVDVFVTQKSAQVLVKHKLLKVKNKKFVLNEKFRPPERSQKTGYLRII